MAFLLFLRKIRYFLLFLVGCLGLCAPHMHRQKAIVSALSRVKKASEMNLIFIDSGIREGDLYFQAFDVFKDLGWRSSFYNLTDLLTLGVDEIFKKPSSISVFMLGVDFWRAPKNSQARLAVCEAIRQARKVRGGVTVFAVPDSLGAQPGQLDGALDRFFSEIELKDFSGFGVARSFEKDHLTQKLKYFLSNPLSTRSVLYDTSLRVAQKNRVGFLEQQVFLKNGISDMAISLPYMYPQRFNSRGPLAQLLPLGMLLFCNDIQHSMIFTSESVLRTLSVSEDFLVMPLKSSLQKSFEKIIQAFWVDVDSWARYAGAFLRADLEARFKAGASSSRLKSVFSGHGFSGVLPVDKKELVGWMELVAFEKNATDGVSEWRRKCRRQQELVNNILDAKLGGVWLSLSPQMYYGVHAKHPLKRKIFEDSCKRFFSMIRSSAREKKIEKLPKVYVGFEIANNLYEPHLPKDFAVDVFGNQYVDMPSPMSKEFWFDEVVKPFKDFMSFHGALSAEDSLPIAGVVFDLELYGRRLEGQFASTMICGAASRNAFLKNKDTERSFGSFVAQLTRQKLWKKYMHFVGGQVFGIAGKIRHEMLKASPSHKLSFLVYTPAVTTDWFFKSFFKGLVPTGERLHWFTFNTNFLRIKKQVELAFGGIKIDHSSVMMLSKVTDNQKLVTRLLENLSLYNTGIWFNRWSRIVDPIDLTAWHKDEQPQMVSPSSKPVFLSGLSQFSYLS